MRKLALVMVVSFMLVSSLALLAQNPPIATGTLTRATSEYKLWDGTDITASPSGGLVQLYSRSVVVPAGPGFNTFFVNLHTTGASPGGQGQFECLIDGNPCIPNANNITTGTDYVALLSNPGPNALTDNGIAYSWCGPLKAGTHTFTLNMVATTFKVWVEAMRVDIDVAKLPTAAACTKAQ